MKKEFHLLQIQLFLKPPLLQRKWPLKKLLQRLKSHP